VNLDFVEPEDELAAGLLKPLRPVNVVLLVETRAEFYQHGNVLAVFGGGAEVLDEARLLSHAVNAYLYRDHRRIVGRLPYHAQKRVHALKRVHQQHVLPAYMFHYALGAGRRKRYLRGELRVRHRNFGVRVEFAYHERQVREFHGRLGHEYLFSLDLQPFAEHPLEILFGGSHHLQSDYVEAAALLQQFFHVEAEVALYLLALLLVVYIGVARGAQYVLRGYLVHLEEGVYVFERYFVESDVSEAVARKEERLRHGIGQRRDAYHGAVPAPQHCRDVDHLVRQVRKRVVRAHDLRRHHRKQLEFEVVPHVLLLVGGEIGDVERADAVLPYLALYLVVHIVALGVERPHGVVDGFQLFAWGQPRPFVHDIALIHDEVAQAAHAHHEEFVEVVREYGHELQPLKDRDVRVLRLFQDALVELEPREFAVLRVTQRRFGICAHNQDSSCPAGPAAIFRL